MGKEVFCVPFRGGCVFRQWVIWGGGNENENVEERGTENENATTIPSKYGIGAKAVADHPSQIARNGAEASDNLNA